MFRLKDFLSFGLPAILFTVLAIVLLFYPVGLQAQVLFFVLAGSAWFIYGLLVYSLKSERDRMIASHPLKLSDRIYVDVGDWRGYGIKEELARVIEDCVSFYPNVRSLLNEDDVFVKFKKGPFPHPLARSMKVMGFVSAGGRIIEVAYRDVDDPASRTAFGHELKHIVIGRGDGVWDNPGAHRIMEKTIGLN